MADTSARSAERRHSPRFACAGRVRMVSLPMEGVCRSAKLRDLSLGGCCLEIPCPLPCGTRAELVIHVNALNFRVLSLVKVLRGRAVGMQFLQLTEAGNRALKEVLADAAKFHAAVSALRSARGRQETDLWRQFHDAKLEPVALQRYPIFRQILTVPPATEAPDPEEEEGTVVSPSGNICLVSVDLFV
jgi:PilZ domain